MDGDFDDSIFENADYLVHTAYIKTAIDVVRSNIDSTKRLLVKSHQYRLKKNIFISSMSSSSDALSSYGKQKYLIEDLFDGKNDTIIRSGLVIGNGGLAKNLINFMKTKHIAPLIDGGKQPIQIIAVKDMAHVIESIIKMNTNGILYIGTPRIYTYKEFYQAIINKLHLKVILIPVPFFIPLYIIRLINFLHLPLAVNEDNLQGLKQLRSYETNSSLEKINITLSELDDALEYISR